MIRLSELLARPRGGSRVTVSLPARPETPHSWLIGGGKALQRTKTLPRVSHDDLLERATWTLRSAPYHLDLGDRVALGCGHFACVYELPRYPGWVRKITGDLTDAAAWQTVLNRNRPAEFPLLAQVISVFTLPARLRGYRSGDPGIDTTPDRLYGIVLQRLWPIDLSDPRFESVDWLIGRAADLTLRKQIYGMTPDFLHNRKLARAKGVLDVWKDAITTFQRLANLGVVPTDIDARNLMIDSAGRYRISDLGVSWIPPVEIPEVDEVASDFDSLLDDALRQEPVHAVDIPAHAAWLRAHGSRSLRRKKA